MNQQLMQAECNDLVINQTKPAAENKPKRKASWLLTILWMISMILLVNVAMWTIAYFLFFRK